MDELRKNQMNTVHKFTERVFEGAWRASGRNLEDYHEDYLEGDGVYTGEQWSKGMELITKDGVMLRVIVTATRVE
jgi:hypothetical protein